MSGSADRLQPSTPELQRDFDQKRLRTDQIMQALDVESQLQTLNQRLYGGQGKLIHVHEGIEAIIPSVDWEPPQKKTDKFFLVSGIILQAPIPSDDSGYEYEYGRRIPPIVFVGSTGIAEFYKDGLHYLPQQYENNGVYIRYFEPTPLKPYVPTLTITPGWSAQGFLQDYRKATDRINPYDPQVQIDKVGLSQQREQVKSMLDNIEEWERKRLSGQTHIPKFMPASAITSIRLKWVGELQERSMRENGASLQIGNLDTRPNTDPALGHAQAAEQANMARRAREFGANSGQPAPTETPLPYNPPTTTPEWRGLRNTNRPQRPPGPTPSQNGRI